jgi:hypothetical protein
MTPTETPTDARVVNLGLSVLAIAVAAQGAAVGGGLAAVSRQDASAVLPDRPVRAAFGRHRPRQRGVLRRLDTGVPMLVDVRTVARGGA